MKLWRTDIARARKADMFSDDDDDDDDEDEVSAQRIIRT